MLVFNPHEPPNSASHWLSIAVFRMKKKLKIGGVIKNLTGKELKKTPSIKPQLRFKTKLNII